LPLYSSVTLTQNFLFVISLSSFGIRVMEASEKEFECFPPSLNFKNSLSRIVLILLELLIISREDIWSWAYVCWKIFDHSVSFSICDSVQFSSVAQSCLTLCNPMNCSMPGLPVHLKGDLSWVFIGRTNVEAETPILWLLYAKSCSFEKTLILEKIEGRRRRG